MDEHHRQLCQQVVGFYEMAAPVEHRLRRTDVLMAISCVASVAAVAFWAMGATGVWQAANVVTGAVIGLGFGYMAANAINRRAAFEALREAHEAASLELAVFDADER
jgi:hypothetical protein